MPTDQEVEFAREVQEMSTHLLKMYCIFTIIQAALCGVNLGLGVGNIFKIPNGGDSYLVAIVALQMGVVIFCMFAWYNDIIKIYEILSDLERITNYIEEHKLAIW
jgi:hypothetical protein